MDMAAALERISAALEEVQVRHAFIGALPVLAWGRPRGTSDFDLVVACTADRLDVLTAALATRGLKRLRDLPSSDPTDPLPDMAIYWTSDEPSIRLDLFIAKLAFEEAVFNSTKDAVIFGRTIKVASRECAVIYKLIASRTKDLADIEGLFDVAARGGESVDWGFLDHWAAEWDIADRLAVWSTRYRRT